MTIQEKKIRRFLSKKISQLNDIIADLDSLASKMETEFYRVSIFGSARISSDSKYYQQVKNLAFELSKLGVDIVTGGGPGLMEAANLGAKSASSQARSFGLAINLPFESSANSHLDVKHQHRRFSSRLDEFMRLSHAVVVTPGGIGTLLEFFYTWQLIQVGHIPPRPVILLGKELWQGLLDWLIKSPLKAELLDQVDLDKLTILDSVAEVITHLKPNIMDFQRQRGAKSKD